MPSYKLYYFNARGRAEVVRYIFAVTGEKYEDIRYEHADWPAHKSNFTFGQLPVLEIDGQQLNQSTAMVHYLALQHGLAGSTPLEAAQCHAFVETLNDLITPLAVQVMREKDESKRPEIIETVVRPVVLEGYAKFEALLAKNSHGFVVGSKASYADFALHCNVQTLSHWFGADFVNAFPHIHKCCEKVESIAAIKEHIEKRPKTQF